MDFTATKVQCVGSAGFRGYFLEAVKALGSSSSRGMFISSCFIHCQSEDQRTWLWQDSTTLASTVSLSLSLSPSSIFISLYRFDCLITHSTGHSLSLSIYTSICRYVSLFITDSLNHLLSLYLSISLSLPTSLPLYLYVFLPSSASLSLCRQRVHSILFSSLFLFPSILDPCSLRLLYLSSSLPPEHI